ncbi:hypothetical protein V1264_014168 [Littorina saxatilis]|uniref:Transposase n=1 Tax=Littorina saxatilis TaxID=31220 RepID=A0AAN9GJG8_9CAEN
MPRLTSAERERAIGRLEAGDTPEAVAATFQCYISTIYRLLQRFVITGSTTDAERIGRPRVTTPRQDRHIFRSHVAHPFRTAAETARTVIGTHQTPISRQTASRRLRFRGLRNCRPASGPVLTVRHRQARLHWALGHLNWNNVRWQNVLFSDESRFCIDHADGRVRVWRRSGYCYADNCVVENNAWGGPSLMLWGAIGHNQVLGPVIFQGLGPGPSNGVTAQRYMDQVLHPHVLPFFQAHGNWVFQHDNARPHTARATQDLLHRSGIQVMPWPALSPDMNPIEQFWDLLQTQLNRVVPRPTTVADLDRAVQQTWTNIPRQASNTLVRSMHRRCQAIIDANGGHTRE